MRWYILIAGMVLGVSVQTAAKADFLPILNSGFESPGGLYFDPEGWTIENGPGRFTGYTNNLAGQLLPPAGTDIGEFSGFTEGGAASASQIIGGHLIQAEATYTLSALVGGRQDSSGFGFGGSQIMLFDADTSSILAEYTLHRGTGDSPLDGIFELQSVSFTTEASGGPIGHRLGIRLTGLGEGPQTWFDNVALETTAMVTAIPEPGSIVMLSIGALGLLGFGWRRQRLAAAS